jgi:small subunit ribosomal protein S4
MRYTGPKVKKARRLGFAFTAKDARILQKRSYAPGQHGQSRSRLSEYGIQLREKQKAKINYGVTERQFERYYSKALNQAGITGDNLIRLLESRLDNVVYRLGFAETRAQARQLVSHGFFEVNTVKVNIPSYHVKPGDQIKVRDSKATSAYMLARKEKMKQAKVQDWLDINGSTLTGKMLSLPSPEQVENAIDTRLIVEHYSRI